MSRRISSRVAVCLAGLLVVFSGCMVGPDFHAPESPFLNSSYVVEPLPEFDSQQLGAWWHSFSDPILTELLSHAETQNLSLEMAYHRIMEARANLNLKTGSLRPNGEMIGEYGYRKRSSNASPFVGNNGTAFNRFELGLLSSWELDFFGRIKRTIQSANAELRFSESDHDHIRLTLLSDVAASYFRIRWLQQQVNIVKESLAVQSETTRLIKDRAKAGLSTELDVTQAKALRHRTVAKLPAIERVLLLEFNRLSVLLGESPGLSIRDFVGSGHLPLPPGIVGVGLPMNLLRNRPDVMRQEHAVEAASAAIGVATADLYPRFTLVGDISVRAKSPSNMFETAGLLFNVGPSFSWNILHFGRICSNIEAKKSRFEQAVAQYQQTVLNAVREVEDAMIGQLGFDAEAEEIEKAIELDKKAIELGLQRYMVGNTNFQRVLDSQQQLLQDQERLLTARAQSLIQRVGIFKSVGGGWQAVEPTAYSNTPTDEFYVGQALSPMNSPVRRPTEATRESADNDFQPHKNQTDAETKKASEPEKEADKKEGADKKESGEGRDPSDRNREDAKRTDPKRIPPPSPAETPNTQAVPEKNPDSQKGEPVTDFQWSLPDTNSQIQSAPHPVNIATEMPYASSAEVDVHGADDVEEVFYDLWSDE